MGHKLCRNSVSVVRQRIAHVGFDPSSAAVFKFFATFREEPDSEEGSSADEGVPRGGASRRGMRDSTTVGVGRTIFEIWDGQTLASPGRRGCHAFLGPFLAPWLSCGTAQYATPAPVPCERVWCPNPSKEWRTWALSFSHLLEGPLVRGLRSDSEESNGRQLRCCWTRNLASSV